MTSSLLQKERLSCEILSAPPFKCHVLPSFPWWRARTMKSTYISESNMLHSKPTLPRIRSAVPKVWARSPLGTQGALSGYPWGQYYLHNNVNMSCALFTLFLFISEFFPRLRDAVSWQTGWIHRYQSPTVLSLILKVFSKIPYLLTFLLPYKI